MKTTVELPDALLEEARTLARERGMTLKELLSSGLRTELERQRSLTSPPEFRFRSSGSPDARAPDRPPHEYA